MAKVIGGYSLPDMPWQDKPEGHTDPVWRYTENPILSRKDCKNANSVFNSAVIPYKDGYIGVFRCDTMELWPTLHVGTSKDGIHWNIKDEKIDFIPFEGGSVPNYAYDPRITEIDGRYYIVFCTHFENFGDTVGMAYTDDFESFYLMEYPTLYYNRNGVLFPRKIGDNYAMLSRPCAPGHCLLGNICYSESPDLTYWGKHRALIRVTQGWQRVKVGGGPTPIETDEGWLLLYHGVTEMCNGLIYAVGGAILDRNDPSKVLYRTRDKIMTPETLYERVGDVGNVVFPCATLCDKDTGRIAIYYGAADTCVGVAFTTVDELIKYIKEHSM